MEKVKGVFLTRGGLAQRYYLVGSNRQKTCFKVLKIDRTLPHDLAFMEDPEVPTPT
jgi:hypothetical protein